MDIRMVRFWRSTIDVETRDVANCLIGWNPKGITEKWIPPVTLSYRAADVFYVRELMVLEKGANQG